MTTDTRHEEDPMQPAAKDRPALALRREPARLTRPGESPEEDEMGLQNYIADASGCAAEILIDPARAIAKKITDNTFDFYESRISFSEFKERNRSLWLEAINRDVDGAVAFLLRPQMM